MAQTTGAMSFAVHEVGISANGSAWTDISGYSASVAVDGGDRMTGEDYTGEGDTAILTYGKREPLEITVKVVFTDGVSDPAETVRAAYEGNTAMYVRYSPQGQIGDFLYTSSEGRVINHTYPQGEAGSADPVMLEFTVRCATLTKSVLAS